MRYRIRNLEKYQAYRDGRSCAWVKMHRKILNNREFMALPDGAWRLAWELICLAYDNDDRSVPGTAEDLSWLLRRKVSVKDLQPLEAIGFISPLCTPPSEEPESKRDRDGDCGVPSKGLHSDFKGTSKFSEKDRSPVVFELQMTNGVFNVTQEHVEKWQKACPGVDIMRDIQSAANWQDANPTKRKTVRGAEAFLFKWIQRTQNNGGSKGYSPQYVNPKYGKDFNPDAPVEE